ncbi:hypothetical protein RAD16_28650 [Bradyrhizobium sp. 18BD]
MESQVKERDARERRRTGLDVRSDAGTKLRRYVLGQEKRGNQEAAEAAPLASVRLHALKDDLITWRESLPQDLKVTTKQRLVNDLKAALNAAWPRLSADRKKLNPTFLAIVKAGFKAERIDEVLLPAIAGRPSDAPLFERWIHEQEPSGIAWKKSERGPWKRGELARPWKAIRERAGMSQVIPYALRHSSIVRGLRKGLPIQQVAKLHNTSVKMIERHYAKYIAAALEDLARAAVVSLVPRTDGNVVRMGKRA